MKTNNIRWGLTLSASIIVVLLGMFAVLFPSGTKETMDYLFNFTIFNLGSAFLWYAAFGTVVMGIIAFSKYGNIQLGGDKPQFNKFKLFAMALSAGMGASTMYWGFIEAAHYYNDPQFGILNSNTALEYATAFNMFHWGPVGWVLYLMAAIPFMAVFYLKKNRDMSLSGVMNSLFNNRIPVWLQRSLDLLFIVTSLAATALTLGLAIPMISSVFSNLTGIPNTLFLGIGIIIALALVYSLSSYMGLEKGMSRLSGATVYVGGLLVVIILIVGPTALILNNATNAVGIVFQDYIKMSFNTNPYGDDGFPQFWTIFFFANWLSYAPGMGIFITRIARGHKLRDLLFVLIGAGSLGTFIIFSVFSTFTLDLVNRNLVDAIGFVENGQPDQLLITVLGQTPFPIVITIIYLISMILFAVTTLDGTSFSLASLTTKKVSKKGNVSPVYRVFWSLLLTVIPIIFLLIDADLNVLKSFPVIIVVPLIPLFIIMILKTLQFVRHEYGDLTGKEIKIKTLDESENDNDN